MTPFSHRLLASKTLLALAFTPLAAAQIPAAEVLIGGPGDTRFATIRSLDVDGTGSWVIAAITDGPTPAQNIYGFLAGTGMTEPGLLRQPQIIQGLIQDRLFRPRVSGSRIAYLAIDDSTFEQRAWIDDSLIAQRGDPFGTAGLTWRFIDDLDLADNGELFLIGRYSLGSGAGFGDVVVTYPTADVVLQSGMTPPGLPHPILNIDSFRASPSGDHWAATVLYEDPATGAFGSAAIVDGAVHTFYTGDAALSGERAPFGTFGNPWVGFFAAQVTDAGEVSVDGLAGGQRVVSRNGRLIQNVNSPFGGAVDMDSDGTLLVKTDDASGLSAEIDGLPLGRDGVFLVDLDGDGQVNPGWLLFSGAESVFPRARFGASGEVLVSAGLLAPDLSGYSVIVRATLALPKDVVCDGEPSSLGRPVNLRAVGTDIASLNDLMITAADLPAQTVALPLYSRDTDFIPMLAGGQGTLCLGGSIGRGVPVFSGLRSDGNVNARLFLSSIPQPTGGVAGQPGDTWNLQVWYRDQLPDGTSTTNLSDAIAITLR